MELTLFVYLCILVVAFLIGATAIGGLLLVPVVVIWGGYPIHAAIPACLFSTFFSGIVGSLIFGRKGHVRLADIYIIALPAGAAALTGAFLLPYLPSKWIEVFIAILCLAAFWVSLRKTENSGSTADPELSAPQLISVGATTGLGSSLSGTGGPLILIPVLTHLGFGAKRSVGLAQVIQLPIGGFAALANVATGVIIYDLALAITGTVIVGSTCGALFAQRTNASMLRPLVSFMLLICGVIYVARLL